MEPINRRVFLKKSTQFVGGVCLCCVAGCGTSNNGTGNLPQTTASGGVVSLSFSDFPNLDNPNGSYQIAVQGSSNATALLVTNINGTVTALSAICTHQGCMVGAWDGVRYTCPCHGSTYNSSGQPTAGPAPSALRSFSVTSTGSGVQIQVG